jgi:hypothetical protein
MLITQFPLLADFPESLPPLKAHLEIRDLGDSLAVRDKNQDCYVTIAKPLTWENLQIARSQLFNKKMQRDRMFPEPGAAPDVVRKCYARLAEMEAKELAD